MDNIGISYFWDNENSALRKEHLYFHYCQLVLTYATNALRPKLFFEQNWNQTEAKFCYKANVPQTASLHIHTYVEFIINQNYWEHLSLFCIIQLNKSTFIYLIK